jgi:DNA-binding transcriptional ArsR family regulator
MDQQPRSPAIGDRDVLGDMQADLFRALAHPLRIRVLELLAQREYSVADLLEETASPPSTMSTHLTTLRRVGVVTARRCGTSVLYRLADQSVEQFLLAVRAFLLDSARRHQLTYRRLVASEHESSDPDRPYGGSTSERGGSL